VIRMNSNKANFHKDMKKSDFTISNILIFKLSLFLVPLFSCSFSFFDFISFLAFPSCLIARWINNGRLRFGLLIPDS
jgi:hypothetical protein